MVAVMATAVAVAASGLPAAAAQGGEAPEPAPVSERPVFAFEFSQGLVTGNFSSIGGMAFGPGGILAVADYFKDRVMVFHANGTLAYQIVSEEEEDDHGHDHGESGAHEGEEEGEGEDHVVFDGPEGVAFGPGGILAVSGRWDDRVLVFHANGTLAYQLGSEGGHDHDHDHGPGDTSFHPEDRGPGEFFEPIGVAFGPGGILAVADSGKDRVQVFHANGTFAYHVGADRSGDDRYGLAVDVDFGPGGILAVTDYRMHRVQVFHANGTFAHHVETGANSLPRVVAFGPGGIMAVAGHDHRVRVFHANGTLAYEFGSWGRGPGEFYYPNSIDFGPGGILAVGELYPYGKVRVQVFHANGTFAYQVGPEWRGGPQRA